MFTKVQYFIYFAVAKHLGIFLGTITNFVVCNLSKRKASCRGEQKCAGACSERGDARDI